MIFKKKLNFKQVLFIGIIIGLVILISVYIYNQIEPFAVPTNDERPFVNVYGVRINNGKEEKEQLPIVLLSHPFTRDSSWKQYLNYKKDGFLILGITSYNEFPLKTTNEKDPIFNPNAKAWTYDYMNTVDGWLYCFRNPDDYIKPTIPKLLLSESDFCDTTVYKPNHMPKKYDFIYVCTKSDGCYDWASLNKNWKLGKRCLKILCDDYNLKGVLIGRKGCDLGIKNKHLITATDFVSQSQLIDYYNQSKFIFVPNQTDASPRVLTEALSCNIPAFLNKNILGGWKYINKYTGEFFTNESDLKTSLDRLLKNIEYYKPRNHYINTYTYKHSGKVFKKFIKDHFSDRINVDYYEYLKL